MGQGCFEHDPDQIQKARDMLGEWNDKNPDQRIIVRIPDVMKKARDMARTRSNALPTRPEGHACPLETRNPATQGIPVNWTGFSVFLAW